MAKQIKRRNATENRREAEVRIMIIITRLGLPVNLGSRYSPGGGWFSMLEPFRVGFPVGII